MHPKIRTLFLCNGNSARSILAEYLLQFLAGDRFEAASAGTHPTGAVHPLALRILRENYHLDPAGAASKSLESLAGRDFDLIITLCDEAREHCPVFAQGQVTAHWGIPDPARVEGDEADRLNAFAQAALQIHRRLELLVSLPLEKLETLERQYHIRKLHDDLA